MSEKRLASSGDSFVGLTEIQIGDLLNKLSDENTRLHKKVDEQQATIQSLKERLYDFEKRKIIEESAIDEDVIPKVKLLRAELFGEKYE